MYKEANQLKLRFQTTKGVLTTEQLFDLSTTELDKLAVELQESYDNSKGKSFLTKRSVKDKTIKLQFDIVLDVLNTKVAIEEEAVEIKNKKIEREKILAELAKRQDNKYSEMSDAQLKSLLK